MAKRAAEQRGERGEGGIYAQDNLGIGEYFADSLAE